MKVQCLHGYYKFSEVSAGEIASFCSTYELDMIESAGDYFLTFS